MASSNDEHTAATIAHTAQRPALYPQSNNADAHHPLITNFLEVRRRSIQLRPKGTALLDHQASAGLSLLAIKSPIRSPSDRVSTSSCVSDRRSAKINNAFATASATRRGVPGGDRRAASVASRPRAGAGATDQDPRQCRCLPEEGWWPPVGIYRNRMLMQYRYLCRD